MIDILKKVLDLVFKRVIRPIVFQMSANDPEIAHEYSFLNCILLILNDHQEDFVSEYMHNVADWFLIGLIQLIRSKASKMVLCSSNISSLMI